MLVSTMALLMKYLSHTYFKYQVPILFLSVQCACFTQIRILSDFSHIQILFVTLLRTLRMKINIIFMLSIVIICLTYQARAGCVFKNPSFTEQPRIEQINLAVLKVSWTGIVTNRACADQFLVKYWPCDKFAGKFWMSRPVNRDSNSLSIELKRSGCVELEASDWPNHGLPKLKHTELNLWNSNIKIKADDISYRNIICGFF